MKTKTRTGKIARLPYAIRDQVNRRLQNGEQAKPLLKWLNALPEVKAVLKAEFEGRPLNPQNVSEWKHGGFRDWQVHQDVLQLAENLEDEHSFGHKTLSGPFSEKLARWLTFRFAAAAQVLTASEPSPDRQWLRLRELCADVSRLRRGDLYAENLRLQREWLALEQSNAEHLREKQFWAWTERPDIKEKLTPPVPGGFSPEALRELEDKFCLMGDDPFESVGNLMRERRLAKEEEEAAAAAQPYRAQAGTQSAPPGAENPDEALPEDPLVSTGHSDENQP